MQDRVSRYSIFGPGQTAGQFRLRQGGTPSHSLPLSCRGRPYGRRQDYACTLPKVLRPPRSCTLQPLASGPAVILLNTLYNGDRPVRSAAPAP